VNLRVLAAAALVAATFGCGATAMNPGHAVTAPPAAAAAAAPLSGPATVPAALAGATARSQVVTHKLWEVGKKGRPVLLVHGWAGEAKEMAYLAENLATRGYAAWSVDLRPADARVADTARGMAQAIDDVLARTGAQKLSLVCHSMGGLDSRYYLHMMWGARKVDRLVTIASPHHGTIWGGLAHGEAKIDLRPGSDLLALLDSFGQPLVPTTSIYSLTDQTVVPQNSAILAGAKNLPHWGLSHTSILRNAQVLDEVLAALR